MIFWSCYNRHGVFFYKFGLPNPIPIPAWLINQIKTSREEILPPLPTIFYILPFFLSLSLLIFSGKNPRKYLRFSSTKLPITTLVFDRNSFSLSLFLSPLYKSFSLFFFPFLSIEKIQGFRKSYLIPFFFVSNFIFKKDYKFE